MGLSEVITKGPLHADGALEYAEYVVAVGLVLQTERRWQWIN